MYEVELSARDEFLILASTVIATTRSCPATRLRLLAPRPVPRWPAPAVLRCARLLPVPPSQACDGYFDVWDSQTLVNLVREQLHEADGNLAAALRAVADRTKKQARCNDNLSIVVVVFHCGMEEGTGRHAT